MASVQFYGADNVIQAAENFRCPAWAIFINGRMFTKFEGTDMTQSIEALAQYLDMLEASNSAGIYTIKFFEVEDGKPIKLNEKSVCNGGSFNFKLISDEQRTERGMAIGSSMHEIRELRKEIEELKKLREEEEAAEPETLGSVLLDLVKRPDQLVQLFSLVKMATGQPISTLPSISAPAMPVSTDAEEERIQRIGNALNELENADPRLPEHLEKLAALAKTNPGQFSQIISLFDLQQ